MQIKKLEEYKNKLIKEQSVIEAEIRQNSTYPDFGDDLHDLDEETDRSDAFTNQMAVVQDLKNRLADVESALKKMEKGAYGICETCGKGIEELILDIDPESRLCERCKALV